jgi:hypothetical protein
VRVNELLGHFIYSSQQGQDAAVTDLVVDKGALTFHGEEVAAAKLLEMV